MRKALLLIILTVVMLAATNPIFLPGSKAEEFSLAGTSFAGTFMFVSFAPPSFAEIPQSILTPQTLEIAPEEPQAIVAPPAAVVPDFAAAVYTARLMRPKQLIEYVWRDTPHIENMLYYACREGGLGKAEPGTHPKGKECDPRYRNYDWRGPGADQWACSADNPTSSAAGLFQTIGIHRDLARAHQLEWNNIIGPDCLDDVLLAKVLYDGYVARGKNPFTPWL